MALNYVLRNHREHRGNRKIQVHRSRGYRERSLKAFVEHAFRCNVNTVEISGEHLYRERYNSVTIVAVNRYLVDPR